MRKNGKGKEENEENWKNEKGKEENERCKENGTEQSSLLGND